MDLFYLHYQATTWHDDYNQFRSSVKDLEVMIQNILNSAFETIRTVQEGVEILNHFIHLSSREAIRRTIDKKTVEIYNIFLDELNAVKKEFNHHKPMIPFLHPKYAGVAVWARSLKKRIDRPFVVLKNANSLPLVGLGLFILLNIFL